MTRINAGIPVSVLSDQHLLAEHRETKRIPNTRFKSSIPKHFTLGSGHVLFFSDKRSYTLNRYMDIHNECIRRGFRVGDYSGSWKNSMEHDNPFVPTSEDTKTVVDRIVSNTIKSKQIPRHCGVVIGKDQYIDMVKSIINVNDKIL